MSADARTVVRKTISLADRLIFPPRCICCYRQISPFLPSESNYSFCDECYEKWKAEQNVPCPDCGKPTHECRGITANLLENNASALIHLAPYYPKRQTVTHNVIFEVKHHADGRLFACLAEELTRELFAEWERTYFNREKDEIVVVYSPRSRKSLAAKGFDQSAMLARAVERKLTDAGYSVKKERKPMIKRVRGVEQKDLDEAERAENAKRSFVATKAIAAVQGRHVILIDDLATTCATLSTCTKLCYEAGAAGVICAVIAKTDRVRRPANIPLNI